jgi:hypothetical protein
MRERCQWQCCCTVCWTHHHPVHVQAQSSKIQDLHDCVHGKRVAFGPKIIGYRDLRVVSEHCLGAFNCAFTHLHMSGSDGQSIVLNAQRTRHLPYPKRLRLMTPVDLAKFCYVDGDLFSSRSSAPIPPMINNRQRWVSYIKTFTTQVLGTKSPTYNNCGHPNARLTGNAHCCTLPLYFLLYG